MWKPVPGYNGDYEVSAEGMVWSNKTNKRLKEHWGGKRGVMYARVKLGGKRQHVHKLVMEAFLGPCPEGMEICHGPAGRNDNSLENLSYGTHSQNMQDRKRDGTNPEGSKNGHAKLTEENVLEIRRRAAAGEKQNVLAKEFNVSNPIISYVVNRKTWTHI